jgi:hypothetical protein
VLIWCGSQPKGGCSASPRGDDCQVCVRAVASVVSQCHMNMWCSTIVSDASFGMSIVCGEVTVHLHHSEVTVHLHHSEVKLFAVATTELPNKQTNKYMADVPHILQDVRTGRVATPQTKAGAALDRGTAWARVNLLLNCVM